MPDPDKILIVDDDPNIAALLLASLSPFGYEITSVHDGRQAREQIETGRFNVAVIDYMLPGVDGIEILRHVREKQIDTAVIMITAYASLEMAVEALRLGAYDYITKPFQIDTIQSTVKRALEKRHLETRLVAIYDLSREMALLRDVDQVVDTVLDIAARVLSFDVCGLALIDEEANELYLVAARGIGQEAALRLSLSDEKGITTAVARSGEVIYVPDTQEDPRYVAVEAAGRSELAVPLTVKDRVIGVLNVESIEPDAFSESDTRLLSTLAAQAAVAIKTVWLYEAVEQELAERKRAEEEIRQRTRELEALNEIGHAITSTLDLQHVLTLIADHTTQLLGVEATSLLLHDQDADDLWFAAGAGEYADSVLGKRLAMGQGVSGWVVQEGTPALVPDVSEDPRWFSGFDKAGDFTTRSMLCVPLKSKGLTVGAIEAINKKSGTFGKEDVWLLSSLAVSAITAIENARLFEEVRVGREQLQALSRRLVEVQEAERGHVARELHDETGQALSSLLLGLSLLEREAGQPEAVVARAVELAVLADEMLENLHRLAMNLRPAALDHLGLVAALDQYGASLGHQHGLTVQFETVGLGEERLLPEVETAIYRIVQEALTNVLRHARATRVDVLLERRGDRVVTIVEDDGVGFDPGAAGESGRLGLFGMRERAKMLGGTLVVESTPGTGATVLVEVPYVDSDPDRR
jgi:signal transduction histidine kinase/DNA-binding response OmpR family regulator